MSTWKQLAQHSAVKAGAALALAGLIGMPLTFATENTAQTHRAHPGETQSPMTVTSLGTGTTHGQQQPTLTAPAGLSSFPTSTNARTRTPSSTSTNARTRTPSSTSTNARTRTPSSTSTNARTRTPSSTTTPTPTPTPAPAPAPAPAPTPSSPPEENTSTPSTSSGPGVFLQVSSLSPTYSVADVANWMAQICSSGTSSAGSTLILQDVDTSSGQLNTPYLNVITPYLPGYGHCFSHVYVGTTGINYTGSGSLYEQGVQSSAVQSEYLTQSTNLAQQLLATYPKLQPDWYLTLEANLNYLDMPAVEQAYGTILTSEIRTLSELDPNASYMWSPGFWYTYSGYSSNSYGMGLLTQGLGTLFQQLKTATIEPITLDLQDEIGTTNCWGSGAMTPQDAVGWANYLDSISNHPSIEMNTTLFETSCATGGTVPISLNQANATESYYASQHIVLGPAYEIRYWLAEHGYSLTTA